MDNKILILLMSCNSPEYVESEQACRETFIKDAEKAGVQYYFYKGDADELTINQETHEMLFPVSDKLAGTSQKTVLAFNEALKMNDWDYIVKTNVSTWLDIRKILKAVSLWEGREDRNIYGARFLTNDASRKVPFPRGHFTILSRTLVRGIVDWAPKLIGAKDFPKTDDTLICLSMLYYVQKVLGDNYRARLFEVPSVTSWTDGIQDATEWGDALSIRCKDETEMKNSPGNIRKTHKLKHAKSAVRAYRRPAKMIETKYGIMSYESYLKTSILFENIKKDEQGYKTQETVVKRVDPEDKLEKIREKLRNI